MERQPGEGRACKSMQKHVRDIQPDQSHQSPDLDVNFPIDDRSNSRMPNCHMIRGYNGRTNVKQKKGEWHSALATTLVPCSLTTLVAIAMHVIGFARPSMALAMACLTPSTYAKQFQACSRPGT